MKRCSLCDKRGNNDKLCKKHRCRCNLSIDSHTLFDGCYIHDKSKKNLQPRIKRD